MKVKIGNTIYDSEEEPIMVILSQKDKENIKNMAPYCTKYCSYPIPTDREYIEKFMLGSTENFRTAIADKDSFIQLLESWNVCYVVDKSVADECHVILRAGTPNVKGEEGFEMTVCFKEGVFKNVWLQEAWLK